MPSKSSIGEQLMVLVQTLTPYLFMKQKDSKQKD
jgi:hypothetical protein